MSCRSNHHNLSYDLKVRYATPIRTRMDDYAMLTTSIMNLPTLHKVRNPRCVE